jgi:hypothetical protein
MEMAEMDDRVINPIVPTYISSKVVRPPTSDLSKHRNFFMRVRKHSSFVFEPYLTGMGDNLVATSG